MNQIQLISGSGAQSNESKVIPKLQDKRPPNINVSKVFSANQKWKECKITGKNVSIRSYSAACTFQNKLYVYGGYQMLNGSLGDFYEISLDQKEEQFHWKEIKAKTQLTPGTRSKHALIGGKSAIYLIGGLQANTQASSDIFKFDPVSQEWTLLKPEGAHLPGVESFGSTYIETSGQERVLIVAGYNEAKATFSNSVYEYNITKNKVSILFEGTIKGSDSIPTPRVGTAVASDGQSIFIFGGKDQENRFNDLWQFNLTDHKWKRMKESGSIPAIRNGHTMNLFDGKLFVFGGIHDITWELDDLHIYDLKSGKWTTLEEDSPRKIDKKANQSVMINESENQKKKKKGNWYDNAQGGLTNKSSSPSHNSPNKKNFSLTYVTQEDSPNRNNESPGKMLDEQRKKAFYQKKAEMLKNFEVSNAEKEKLVSLQTASQAMKNSLDVIGNPDPKAKNNEDKLTDFGKQSVSKFLGPLQNNSNIVVGKKPCARDGHCSVIMGGQLVIFGGDRHQMSFNDIYKMDLKMAERDLPAEKESEKPKEEKPKEQQKPKQEKPKQEKPKEEKKKTEQVHQEQKEAPKA